jgi:hypothetical protein
VKLYLRQVAVFACLAALLVSGSRCFASTDSPPVRFVLLTENWFDLHLGYKCAEAQQKLRTVSLASPLFVIGPHEIEAYDWGAQQMVLTPEATTRLVQAVAVCDKQVSEPIRKLNALKASLGHGSELERTLYLKAFVVRQGENTTYGGIVLDAMSQMAIHFPVMRVSVDGDRAVLSILPVHAPFLERNTTLPTGQAEESAVNRDGLADWKHFPEGFKSALRSSLSSPDAAEMRRLIMSTAIKKSLEREGKLK